MAFRMKRSAANDKQKEPMRKRRKLNTLFDTDDVAALSKKAEISAPASLTADEKRIAIGKRLLAAAKESIPDSDEEDTTYPSDDMDDDQKQLTKDKLIHNKLMSTIGQKEGKYRFRIANKLRDYITKHKDLNPKLKALRGHRLSVTCMALDPTGKDRYIITGSKDGSIIKWDLKTGKKLRKIWHAWPINNKNKINPKTGKKLRWGGLRYDVYKKIRPKPVLAVAISPDEKWLVSGGEDCLIRVWNVQTMRYKSTFRGGHQSKVTGLAFSRDDNKSLMLNDDMGTSNTLFSTGADRQIRVYDMNEMGFAEPLYGHTEGINSIDTTNEDRCITVSDDKTIRYWKLRTQSQLIFNNGHDESIDACCILTPGRFVTGSQDGSIALWSTARKHPLCKEKDVHLTNNKLDIKRQSQMRHWIVSLSAKHNCDVFASGSSDGVVKLWAVKKNNFTHLRSIKIPKGGFINVMKWTEKGDKIICGVGTEHRLGRWDHVKGAKNGIVVIKLPVDCMEDDVNEDGKDEVEDMAEEEDDNLKVAESEDVEDGMKYEEAENWDKWDPKERGEYVSDGESGSTEDKEKEAIDAFVEDDDDDEWQSFFGNVFR